MSESIKSKLEKKITEEEFDQFYNEGFVCVSNVFTEDEINRLVKAKDECFKKFPLGHLVSGEPRKSKEQVDKDWYNIYDVYRQDPIFSEIISKPIILETAERILGDGFFIAELGMRKVDANTDTILGVHRDQCGCLSVRIVLDDTDENEGGTVLYPRTHLNHPPPHFGVRDLSKFDPEQTVQTTGKKGDVWFWTPDLWHGRSPNLSKTKATAQLAADFLNCRHYDSSLVHTLDRSELKKLSPTFQALVNRPETEKKLVGKSKKIEASLKKVGNSPNSLWDRFMYQRLALATVEDRRNCNDKKYSFTRIINEKYYKNIDFSLRAYFKKVILIRAFKAFLGSIVRSLSIGNLIALTQKRN